MTTQFPTIGDTDNHPIFKAMAAKPPLTTNTISLSLAIPRRLYIELYNGWEHDMAIEAGVFLRRDAAIQLQNMVPRLSDTDTSSIGDSCRHAQKSYAALIESDTAWIYENTKPADKKDWVTVTVPLPCELLDFDAWSHWTFVHVGRYLGDCIVDTLKHLGDGELKGLRAEWREAYPDCW